RGQRRGAPPAICRWTARFGVGTLRFRGVRPRASRPASDRRGAGRLLSRPVGGRESVSGRAGGGGNRRIGRTAPVIARSGPTAPTSPDRVSVVLVVTSVRRMVGAGCCESSCGELSLGRMAVDE